MALLTVFTGGECLFAIVAGPAVFPLAESLHGQRVACIGNARFFLEQAVMAVAAPYSRTFVGIMIERYGSEAFGILEHDSSRPVIRLNRRSSPQQTDRNEVLR